MLQLHLRFCLAVHVVDASVFVAVFVATAVIDLCFVVDDVRAAVAFSLVVVTTEGADGAAISVE